MTRMTRKPHVVVRVAQHGTLEDNLRLYPSALWFLSPSTPAGVLPLWAYEGEEHGRVWWDYRVSRVVCRACALKASARGWLDACGSEFARVLSPSPDARMVLLTDERNLELLTSAVAAIPSGAVSGGTVADAGTGGRWGIAAVRSFQLSPTTTGLPPLMPCSSTHNTRTGPRLHYRLLTLCPAAY